jgi:hypothetical protein
MTVILLFALLIVVSFSTWRCGKVSDRYQRFLDFQIEYLREQILYNQEMSHEDKADLLVLLGKVDD